MLHPERDARTLRLNGDTGLIKVVACLCMLSDHLGKMIFPNALYISVSGPWAFLLPSGSLLRIIGRLAMPMFCYCIAVGCAYSRNVWKYALRLLLMGVLVHPLYMAAMGHVKLGTFDWAHNFYRIDLLINHYLLPYPSILFSLFAGILVIWTIRERQYALTGVLLAICWYLDGCLDFGIKGILLMVLFYALLERPLASFLWAALFMCWWGGPSLRTLAGIRSVLSGGALTVYTQFYAVLALPLIYLPLRTGIRVPKYVSYLFYPAHLALIYLLTM